MKSMEYILTPECIDTMVVKGQYADVPCLRVFVAKVLSLGILCGSLLVKFPQILAIVAAGSAEGLSPASFYIDLGLAIATVAYNFLKGNPFSSYGEMFFIAVQNAILVLLLWRYMKKPPSGVAMLGISASFAAFAVGALQLPSEYQYVLPLMSLPLMLTSRCAQIYTNYINRSTGQLSVVTVFLFFAGGLARIFTTIQQVGYDYALLSTHCAAAIATGTILLQIVVYWPKKGSKKGKKTSKED